ncbi:hypothetical protein SERLA73DRAFT_185709 [Serpula lacrymans var. lacrymans S7.3]|uniref:Uncharacterized protein n=1 Tax=Serpula lacrymans var. lacrymans (strain S7.3) TaxID=936435 RepID=F8Q698_SERL3|nr:hypothetical protein SERLA73DRAFT_185709 [Serpula lacrymans var. lacrymans S7.3]
MLSPACSTAGKSERHVHGVLLLWQGSLRCGPLLLVYHPHKIRISLGYLYKALESSISASYVGGWAHICLQFCFDIRYGPGILQSLRTEARMDHNLLVLLSRMRRSSLFVLLRWGVNVHFYGARRGFGIFHLGYCVLVILPAGCAADNAQYYSVC